MIARHVADLLAELFDGIERRVPTSGEDPNESPAKIVTAGTVTSMLAQSLKAKRKALPKRPVL
jgi:hypothetical protein